MPRKARSQSDAGIYHFINRGVIKKALFHKAGDYENYKELMEMHAHELGIKIYHYCLMTNHTHILLRAPDLRSLSRFGYYVLRRYAHYYSKTYAWQEQVFRKRFVSIPINKDSYLLECGRYIERNPVRAKMVEDPRNFEYSSYRFYAMGKKDRLVTPNPLYEDMGLRPAARMFAYREYVGQSRPYEEIVDNALSPF